MYFSCFPVFFIVKSRKLHSYKIAFVRNRFRFDLLKTCVIALRGHIGKCYEKPSYIARDEMNMI